MEILSLQIRNMKKIILKKILIFFKYVYPPSISKVNLKDNIRSKNNRVKKIIYVGNLFKEKGVITIIKALAKLKMI